MESTIKKTACITGATSGIGAAFAKKLAEQGFDLIITGRRKEIIEAFANNLSNEYKVTVKVIIAELSDDERLDLLSKTVKETENLEILVNNAGFNNKSYFHEEDISLYEKMIKVHNLALIRLCHCALPNMISKGKGTIINVSSIAALVPVPVNSVYSASKSFVKIFSESIHLELKGTGVNVQALCPGMTITDFHERIGFDRNTYYKNKGLMKAMTPEDVVEISLQYIKKDKAICIPGKHNLLLSYLFKIVPQPLLYKMVSSIGSIKDKTSTNSQTNTVQKKSE